MGQCAREEAHMRRTDLHIVQDLSVEDWISCGGLNTEPEGQGVLNKTWFSGTEPKRPISGEQLISCPHSPLLPYLLFFAERPCDSLNLGKSAPCWTLNST